ncbi:hypothetical protein K0M31_009524 [Melipona bicolor]|uniref:Uncharacterized protein n=1 Tax=Melipona bicolor TaxID=60889 RepID=A0AA40KJD0_9HYME|nr:hypothetical protein K0M31_009524 [Melipona bicolor]
MVDKGEITKTPSPLNINDAIEGEVLNQKTARILRNDLLLYEAVIKNEADTVRKVLKETVDVNSRNNVSRTEPDNENCAKRVETGEREREWNNRIVVNDSVSDRKIKFPGIGETLRLKIESFALRRFINANAVQNVWYRSKAADNTMRLQQPRGERLTTREALLLEAPLAKHRQI